MPVWSQFLVEYNDQSVEVIDINISGLQHSMIFILHNLQLGRALREPHDHHPVRILGRLKLPLEILYCLPYLRFFKLIQSVHNVCSLRNFIHLGRKHRLLVQPRI